VDAVSTAFQVTFARVATSDGEFTSAITAPSLPADISPSVLGIHGLQPHIRRRPLSMPKGQPRQTINLGSGYTPSQIAAAYNATGVTATGAGQTIAFYEVAFPANADLSSFWTAVGSSQTTANVKQVSVAGGPASSTDSNSQEEAALDVEWAGALAPGAALRVYGANENDPALNDEILQQVFADIPGNPTMHQLCICLGGNELEVERDYLTIQAQYMANLASAGVSVLVASGDNGAYADGALQTTYPTSDPDVTGVGGTSLTLGSGNAVTSETAWSGSGGGVSVAFGIPSWQTGAGVPVGSTMRLVPDVSATADPNLGALVVFGSSSTSSGQSVVGGTSWATPIWAAFCALINQGRSTPLGLLNPKIYPLIGTSSFRDITTGSNGYYSAGPGYDLCTGVGSPLLMALLADPLAPANPLSVPAQLGSQTVTAGQPATFYVVGVGPSPLTYQWQMKANGASTFSNLANNATYVGVTTGMLVVNGTTTAMSGEQFQCVVSNASGSVTSAPADTLTVNLVGVTTLAGWPGSGGSANGTGWAARFSFPGSVRTDSSGNVYVADSYNDTIRKVTPAGVVTLVAGTPGTSGSTDGPVATALFNATAGVAVDSSGDLFVADDGNNEIREISAAGVVTTIAGKAGSPGTVNGTGSTARFADPQNLAIDSSGNLYVADGNGNTIRKVAPGGVVTTLAGSGTSGSSDGTGTAAQFNDPTGVTVDPQGNVYVADYGNSTIRMITPSGVVTTLAGVPRRTGSADGTGATARFYTPSGIGIDGFGNLYVADSGNDTIREVTQGGVVTTIAGSPGIPENIDGPASAARFDTPGDVAVDPSGIVYVADSENDTIRRIIPGASAAAPSISAQPASQTVNEGTPVVFSLDVTGTPPFTYQWYFDGSSISGATGPTYAVAGAQQSNVGNYSVSVSNAQGSATSASATLTVAVPPGFPDIISPPQGATLQNGGSVPLSVTVTGNGPFTYQWTYNGGAISGATAPTYTATAPGSYAVSVTNSLGSATSAFAVVSPTNRLTNVSSRELVGTGSGIAIAGFVIYGAPGQTKQLLIRGVGPQLAAYGLSGLLAQPTISVYNAGGTVIATNTGWGNDANSAQVAAVSSQLGAFTLPAGSNDCALLAELAPGNYSVELSGVNSTTGVGLVEVYETDTADPTLLANISTRAQVGAGGNTLIAGFNIFGTQPATVLVRGVGPTLAQFITTGFLAHPVLKVLDANQNVVGSNTGWTTGTQASLITADSASSGAFALVPGSADSALVLSLAPGTYTAEVTSADSTTGIALAEVYLVLP
jgi:sugar lactone lactonase YvrE